MAHPKRTVYDLLAKKTIEEVTTAQLAASVESTAVDKETIEFWTGPITIQRVLELRTYCNGNLPIPEGGAVFTEEVGVFGQVDIQPPGSEVWEIKAIRGFGVGGACDTTMAYASPTGSVDIRVGDTIAQTGTNYTLNTQVTAPIQLTNTMYLIVQETGGSNGLRILVAYQVMSL